MKYFFFNSVVFLAVFGFLEATVPPACNYPLGSNCYVIHPQYIPSGYSCESSSSPFYTCPTSTDPSNYCCGPPQCSTCPSPMPSNCFEVHPEYIPAGQNCPSGRPFMSCPTAEDSHACCCGDIPTTTASPAPTTTTSAAIIRPPLCSSPLGSGCYKIHQQYIPSGYSCATGANFYSCPTGYCCGIATVPQCSTSLASDCYKVHSQYIPQGYQCASSASSFYTCSTGYCCV